MQHVCRGIMSGKSPIPLCGLVYGVRTELGDIQRAGLAEPVSCCPWWWAHGKLCSSMENTQAGRTEQILHLDSVMTEEDH